MKTVLLYFAVIGIFIMLVSVMLPPIWPYVGITYKTFGYYSLTGMLIACFSGSGYAFLKIKELNK